MYVYTVPNECAEFRYLLLYSFIIKHLLKYSIKNKFFLLCSLNCSWLFRCPKLVLIDRALLTWHQSIHVYCWQTLQYLIYRVHSYLFLVEMFVNEFTNYFYILVICVTFTKSNSNKNVTWDIKINCSKLVYLCFHSPIITIDRKRERSIFVEYFVKL